MKYFKYVLLVLSFNVLGGDLDFAPKDFQAKGNQYNFVDIQTADYQITYDVKTAEAKYFAHLVFKMESEGYPLFDVVNPADKITIGRSGTRFEEEVKAQLVSFPGNDSQMYSVDKKLEADTYHLKLSGTITELVQFNGTNVRSAFWMSDLSDRSFLEKYLPSNLDYDQMVMSFEVKILNSDFEHLLMINCESELLGLNHWKATCPEYYNSALLFYHLFNKGAFKVKTFDYSSIDKRKLKITIYTNEDLENYAKLTEQYLTELENDYGPWLHDGLIIYGTGGMFGGGMEYAGATLTSVRALGHEMHHSYFARAMSPAGGNAGWIDEALASWRDNGYPSGGSLSRTRMGGHSSYQRFTDRGAYTKGMSFIAQLDKKFADKNGLMPFLKEFGQTHKYKANTTPLFQKKLEDFFAEDLSSLFNTYIYGKEGTDKKKGSGMLSIEENPYHPTLTPEELRKLL